MENKKNKKRENSARELRGSALIPSRDAYLSSILATTTEAIISIDADQRIVLFNAGAERVFGYAEDEALGKSIEILIPPAFREKSYGRIWCLNI